MCLYQTIELTLHVFQCQLSLGITNIEILLCRESDCGKKNYRKSDYSEKLCEEIFSHEKFFTAKQQTPPLDTENPNQYIYFMGTNSKIRETRNRITYLWLYIHIYISNALKKITMLD